MSAPGWHTDPTGRFSQRWFDGNDWSAHVVGANGQTIQDPISTGTGSGTPPAPQAAPASTPAGTPSPPPAPHPNAPGQPAYPPPPPPAYVAPAAPAYASPAYQSNIGQPGAWPGSGGPQTVPRSEARYGPGIGLAISALGIVLVLLSLFVLKWAKGDHSAFSDIHSAATKSSGGSLGFADTLTKAYAQYAAYVYLVLAIIGVGLAGFGLPRSRGSRLVAGFFVGGVVGIVLQAIDQDGTWATQLTAALVAGAAAIVQTVAIERLFRGPASPQIGAWLGVVGYLVVIVGVALGARRVGETAT